MSGLLIVGAGGHGKVVAEAAEAVGQWQRIAFVDRAHTRPGRVMHWPLLGGGADPEALSLRRLDYPELIVAIGNNARRLAALRALAARGFTLPAVIHPSAAVSPSAKLGGGCAVLAQAAVNAETRLGVGVIVNTGASVDHECDLGDGVHIAPGVRLAGGVRVGGGSWVGIGASVIQQITIGANAMIGAGSVVLDDVPDGVTVAGVPAKLIDSSALEQ